MSLDAVVARPDQTVSEVFGVGATIHRGRHGPVVEFAAPGATPAVAEEAECRRRS